MNSKIAILGTGNVAWHLAHGFAVINEVEVMVWGRNPQALKALAESANCHFSSDLGDVCEEADLIVMAVTDRSIESLAHQLTDYSRSVIAHTSGSVGMDVLTGVCKRYGVFYPLNTFSKSAKLDWQNTPFFIESSDKDGEDLMLKLAQLLSKNVRLINSETRRKLHIAAVFACNFTNYFYGLAEELLEKNNLSFDLLRPLIKQTAEKAMEQLPSKLQTGPAARKDMSVIAKHITALENNPKHQELYELISNYILGEDIL